MTIAGVAHYLALSSDCAGLNDGTLPAVYFFKNFFYLLPIRTDGCRVKTVKYYISRVCASTQANLHSSLSC